MHQHSLVNVSNVQSNVSCSHDFSTVIQLFKETLNKTLKGPLYICMGEKVNGGTSVCILEDQLFFLLRYKIKNLLIGP